MESSLEGEAFQTSLKGGHSMPVPVPNLDDRTFQQLVDEAKRRIPHYCPEWTDHNVSDPGVTLIELFAGMVETLIFRLNRVPEKNYRTFMNLMGLNLEPPTPARAELTFALASPRDTPVVLPAATEAETQQTAGRSALRFSTDREFAIQPPKVIAVLRAQDEPQRANDGQQRKDGQQREAMTVRDDVTAQATARQAVAAFDAFLPQQRGGPTEEASFLIGFEQNLSGHILRVEFELDQVEGLGIRPDQPPLQWEGWCGESWGWRPIEWEDGTGRFASRYAEDGARSADSTAGLNRSGAMVLHLPRDPRPLELKSFAAGGRELTGFWIRCRYTGATETNRYAKSPRVRRIITAALGATITATHASTVHDEVLGKSNGEPGQVFQLWYHPLLPRDARQRQVEVIEVQDPEKGTWERWEEREHFADSKANQQHYVIDNASGQVSFGPRIRCPDGTERQHGLVPLIGSTIMMRCYRFGGGALAVGRGEVDVLPRTITLVDWVTNRRQIVGGMDAETVEHAQLRAARMLRSSVRAVTAEDFAYHACDDPAREVARATCIVPGRLAAGAAKSAPDVTAPTPGTVRVLIVPRLDRRADQRISAAELTDRVYEPLLRRVHERLNQRRLITTSLEVTWPIYVELTVRARLRISRGATPTGVADEAQRRLLRYLNPFSGGPDGEGWPFGRTLYLSEIYNLFYGIRDLIAIETVELTAKEVPSPAQPTAPATPERTISSARPEPKMQIDLSEGHLFASGLHDIQALPQGVEQ
jgi:predicted phage baseplate assembly protein